MDPLLKLHDGNGSELVRRMRGAGGHETRPYSVEGWTHWAVSEER